MCFRPESRPGTGFPEPRCSGLAPPCDVAFGLTLLRLPTLPLQRQVHSRNPRTCPSPRQHEEDRMPTATRFVVKTSAFQNAVPIREPATEGTESWVCTGRVRPAWARPPVPLRVHTRLRHLLWPPVGAHPCSSCVAVAVGAADLQTKTLRKAGVIYSATSHRPLITYYAPSARTPHLIARKPVPEASSSQRAGGKPSLRV